MITRRPSEERGKADYGWLKTSYSFSFAEYHDRAHMGFRSLRVINEDHIAGGMGFGTHPHRDMEILTYILSGRLAHKDSMGNGREIHAGQLQTMSAGSGIQHSEFNASPTEPVHLLQIWIRPHTNGIAPRYAEWNSPFVNGEAPPLKQTLLASPDGREGSASIAQDAFLYLVRLQPGEEIRLPLNAGRAGWVQVMRGAATLNGTALGTGDGAAVEEENELHLTATESLEALVFDLA